MSLTLAISKGKLIAGSEALFRRAGLPFPNGEGRKLVVPAGQLRFLFVKDMDVPTYVEYGVADCGVAGRDVLLETGADVLEPLDLGFGRCRVVVASPEGKEMILRFAKEDDMDTSYAAWKLRTPAPYSIRAVTRARVAKLPLPQWAAFLEEYPDLKEDFEYEVMFLMSEVMAHTITLHLLDAPGRVHRFERKHPELSERVPKKELASYLNLSAETLSRLKHAGKI